MFGKKKKYLDPHNLVSNMKNQAQIEKMNEFEENPRLLKVRRKKEFREVNRFIKWNPEYKVFLE